MQQFLKSAGGAARAEIVAPQLFQQLFVAVNDSWTAEGALDARFGGKTLLPFTCGFETRRGLGADAFS
jgi:hypothetical protein